MEAGGSPNRTPPKVLHNGVSALPPSRFPEGHRMTSLLTSQDLNPLHVDTDIYLDQSIDTPGLLG
jgi:hypothetical protein